MVEMGRPTGPVLESGEIIHLLGLAPARYSTAPDNGPWALAEVVRVGIPLRSDGYQGHAGPLNLLNLDGGRNLRGGKVTTQVPEGLPFATHVSVALEPPPSRKLPVLLAFWRVVIG
jgi:hypothetical protein